MPKKINVTIEQLWEIAKEINKKEKTKKEILKSYNMSVRTFTDKLKNTGIYYKSNKEGYVFESENTKKQENNKENSNIKNPVGRPRKYSKSHEELKKLTIEVDKKIYNALQFKKINEGITINKYIENLLMENIESAYFDMVDKLKNKK